MKICKCKSQLNKGFTLVELIVSVAILAIVGAAIIAFFSMSLTQYRSNTSETNIQTESQLAWKRLESNILSTTSGIWIPNNHEIDLYNDRSGSRTVTKIFYEPDSENHTIYYQEYDLEGNAISDKQVFADLVTAFTIEMYDEKGDVIYSPSEAARPVKVKAHSEYDANGRTYVSDNTVAIRNTIVASNDPNVVYAER